MKVILRRIRKEVYKMSFLNVRVRSWGVMVMVDVFARFGDELFGQFWNGTSNNENSSSFAVDCTDEKIN
jgi:hypothetical protein